MFVSTRFETQMNICTLQMIVPHNLKNTITSIFTELIRYLVNKIIEQKSGFIEYGLVYQFLMRFRHLKAV
jgi:hypothetical protein